VSSLSTHTSHKAARNRQLSTEAHVHKHELQAILSHTPTEDQFNFDLFHNQCASFVLQERKICPTHHFAQTNDNPLIQALQPDFPPTPAITSPWIGNLRIFIPAANSFSEKKLRHFGRSIPRPHWLEPPNYEFSLAGTTKI